MISDSNFFICNHTYYRHIILDLQVHSIDKLFCSVRFDQMCSENVKKALNNGNFEIEDDKDQILEKIYKDDFRLR